MELEDTIVEIDEERVRDLHEDCEVNGDVEKFVADYQYLIWDCLSHAGVSEQRVIERPSKWGEKIDRLYKLMYELDVDLQHQLDERHQSLSGRRDTLFSYLHKVVEPTRDALHDDIETFKDNGRYRVLMGKEDADLFLLSVFCRDWGISVEAVQGTFFDLASLIKSDLGTTWDIYKLPERMNKICTPK